MQGISKNLVSRAFPSGPERPDYLTSEEFVKFTPTEDFMSLPGEIFRTEFRLVVTHEGWEYTVLERELGAHVDPLRKMLVTVSGTVLQAAQEDYNRASRAMPCVGDWMQPQLMTSGLQLPLALRQIWHQVFVLLCNTPRMPVYASLCWMVCSCDLNTLSAALPWLCDLHRGIRGLCCARR